MADETLADRLEALAKDFQHRAIMFDAAIAANPHASVALMWTGEAKGGAKAFRAAADAILAALRTAPAEAARGAVQPVECWAILDPDGNIDIDNVWRSDEMAEWASELHRAESIRVRITPIAPPDAAQEDK
jgi:hypothetical protein